MKTKKFFLIGLIFSLFISLLFAQEELKQQQKINAPLESKGSMNKANETANELLKLKMKTDAPLDYKVLQQIKDSDIIVVKGIYDHLQDVLNLSKIPFSLIEPEQVSQITLSPHQFLMINCPGSSIDDRGIKNIQSFVEKGGYLFTTDWTVKYVLEKAFPGIVKYNEHPTTDDVVRIEIKDLKNPFVKYLFTKSSEPVWWLEGSSYPITVLNKGKVKVLIVSKEMKEKYGEEPIALTFSYGKGKVFHMTSHFYLQRAELRTARHKKTGDYYAKEELKLNPQQLKELGGKLKEVNLGELESAYTSQQFITNILVQQQKDKKGIGALNGIVLLNSEVKEKPDKKSKTITKIKKTQKIIMLKKESDEWILIETSEGKKGFVPSNCVKKED